jgi:uncharacterized membrane protein YraQ (UPF0718 family)
MRISRTDLVFVGLAIVSGVLCYELAGLQAVSGALLQATTLLIVILPQLAGGLLIGGLVHQMMGKEKIAALLGSSSGLRGLMIATFAGALTPGGPFTSFPIVYALWMAGAEVGALIAYIASWSLLGFARVIVWELPLMGAEFTWIRVLVSLPLPIVAGLLARQLFRLHAFRLDAGTGK